MEDHAALLAPRQWHTEFHSVPSVVGLNLHESAAQSPEQPATIALWSVIAVHVRVGGGSSHDRRYRAAKPLSRKQTVAVIRMARR